MIKLILPFTLLSLALGVPFRHAGRIVGGEKGKIENFPYQISLRIFDEHFCGGSIIDENTILTAAHCVDEIEARHLSVMVGSSKVDGGIVHTIERIRQHPSYNDDTTDYDVAIIKLATSIDFNDKAAPISLQKPGDDVAVGTVATVSGWGVLGEKEEDTPEDLRYVDVGVISEEDCRSSFSSGKITPRMFCAKRPGVDSCQGDSGGPLVANKKLIGVVSWGVGCARPNYPGVYTKLSDVNVHRWIERNR